MTKVILVSGSSRGIGRSIAERLLSDNYQLSLGVRNPETLNGTSLDSDHVLRHSYEAQDPESASAWVKATLTRWGRIDGLIHCAGILRITPLLFGDGEEEDLDELWNVNVMGPWRLTKAAWPALCRSGEGRVQVLVSMSGKRVKGQMAGYPISKFALMGLCQSMRNTGWDQGIRVTALCPSWVNTEMARDISHVLPEEMTQPSDLAALSSQLLALPNAAIPFEVALNCALER